MQRLGINKDRYAGEQIDLDAVLAGGLRSAAAYGWQIDTIPVEAGPELVAFRRSTGAARKRAYLSTGIHGDEPAGPLAVRRLLEENSWPENLDLWVCPCLNPSGFKLNRRENAQGLDLNRDYRHLQSAEIRAHVAWLRRQPQFELTLCLHEDWEAHGFYLYELNPDAQPSLAEAMIAGVQPVCPIDPSPLIEGREAENGIIRPNLDPRSRPQWPESFFLIQTKTRLSYTLEAPSDFTLATRANALVAAARTALALISES